MLKRGLNWLRPLLPRACPGCGQQLGRETGLCVRCCAGLRPHLERHSVLTPDITPHLVTLGRYDAVLRRSVRALKFSGVRDLAGPLGLALAQGVPAGWQVRAVVPVPLHPRRERERGYNQAELLARSIAAELQVPCLPLLSRTRYTAAQSRRHAAQRQHLTGAFQVTRVVPPGTLLLVDDVLTTGYTLQACRDALLDAGVSPANLKYAVVAR
ncbi:ComF family protein [Deinococcus fonticola]|uniref:ComF family protein n=1 Tax=Deinococcus fonticola TaxID=2528713 RepID=UPI001F0DBD79|nr:ComF family protein [Deinococcus fonticola]